MQLALPRPHVPESERPWVLPQSRAPADLLTAESSIYRPPAHDADADTAAASPATPPGEGACTSHPGSASSRRDGPADPRKPRRTPSRRVAMAECVSPRCAPRRAPGSSGATPADTPPSSFEEAASTPSPAHFREWQKAVFAHHAVLVSGAPGISFVHAVFFAGSGRGSASEAPKKPTVGGAGLRAKAGLLSTHKGRRLDGRRVPAAIASRSPPTRRLCGLTVVPGP